MVHIALCDDDTVFLNKLHLSVKEWFAKNRPEQNAVIEAFTDGQALLNDSDYDIFFLDIEMPKISGLDLAKQIKERYPHAIVIFLTSHQEFAMEGYRVSAIRYLWKLELDQYLSEALTAAMKEFSKIRRGNLSIQRYGSTSVLPFEEIIYVRHVLRFSQIHTVSYSIIKDNRGIQEIYSLLDAEQFVFIERGAFINLDYLFQIQGNEVVLKNNERLSVSRNMLPKLKMTINRLWGRE